jgi:glycosyltransferase involved in cell wall biosynthesis
MCQSRLKKRIFYALVGKQALSAASSVHLATRAEFEQSKKWFPPERGVVIPNVLDLTPFRSLPSPSEIQDRLCTLPKSAFKVLFLSRLHPIKGLEVVLRAANILKHRGREVALVVAGDGDPGYFQSVRALATELNLGSHEILFLGSVTGRLKLALFQSCNVFALPTQHENFGYVLVEALACGLPVITTKASGLSVEIASSGVGQVADATPEGFADAIEVMLDNRATLELVGKTARPWAFDYLDSRQVIARYVQMYSDSVT